MDIASEYETIRPRYPELTGQVAVVTGSSRGIGKGIALRLAREGMELVLHGVDRDEIESTADEFQQLGVPAVGICADFTDDAAIKVLFEATVSAYGTVDLLVNN